MLVWITRLNPKSQIFFTIFQDQLIEKMLEIVSLPVSTEAGKPNYNRIDTLLKILEKTSQ